jgi:hypothetical protein
LSIFRAMTSLLGASSTERVAELRSEQRQGATCAMATKVDARWVNIGQVGEIIVSGEDIVHFAIESLVSSWIVVTPAQRREHHEDAGVAVGSSGLVVVAWTGAPDIIDGVAVASREPDDRRVPAAVLRIQTQVCPKGANC